MGTASYLQTPLILLGLILAYLVNHLANSLPNYRSLSQPVCRYCLGTQPWSIFLFGKKCPECGKTKGCRFWLMLGLIPILFLLLTGGEAVPQPFWLLILMITYFTTVFVIDIEHKVILDQTTYFGVFFGLIAGTYSHGLLNTLLGGLAGFFFFYLIYKAGKLLFSKIKFFGAGYTGDPIGFGDVKLAAVIGLVLGWPSIGTGLVAAIFIGGIFSLLFIFYQKLLGKYQPFIQLPYGPYLIAGMVFAILVI